MDTPETTPRRLENFQAWQQARALAALTCELLARPPLRDNAALAPALAQAVIALAGDLAASHALPAESSDKAAAQRAALGACARAESLLLLAGDLRLIAPRDLSGLGERLTAARMLTHGLLRAKGAARPPIRPAGSPGPSRRPPSSGGGSRGDGPWDSRS